MRILELHDRQREKMTRLLADTTARRFRCLKCRTVVEMTTREVCDYGGVPTLIDPIDYLETYQVINLPCPMCNERTSHLRLGKKWPIGIRWIERIWMPSQSRRHN